MNLKRKEMKSNMKTNTIQVWKRLLSYVVGKHKALFAAVVVCILLSSCTVVVSSLFLEVLIDDFISPLLLDKNPVFTSLLHTLLILAVIYTVGTISTYLYNRLMVKISQSTLKEIRDDMFIHMQRLPIRYFDTHTHGDIMSHYTNDTDTLRQFISQTLPQFISAIFSIVAIFIAMIISNVPLTILVIIFTVTMVIVTEKIGGASSKYFIKQQETLGNITGYIEEMINGQKVVKVFCHEDQAKQEFDKRNKKLCNDSCQANKFGNIIMPAILQIGNLQYVLIALVGGLMALNGAGSVSVGMIVAFLNLSKTYCLPISQIAQ